MGCHTAKTKDKASVATLLMGGGKWHPVDNSNDDCYCYFDESYGNPFRFSNGYQDCTTMGLSWNTREWEKVVEKVDKYLWVVRYSNGKFGVTDNHYATDVEAQCYGGFDESQILYCIKESRKECVA